jgi:hypothetical protein
MINGIRVITMIICLTSGISFKRLILLAAGLLISEL